MTNSARLLATALFAAPLLCMTAMAQDQTAPTTDKEADGQAPTSPAADTDGRPVTDIVNQPLRDLNLKKMEIPAALQTAFAAPYSNVGLKNCRAIKAEIDTLEAALGPDFDKAPMMSDRTRAANTAIGVGGRLLSGFIMPFRGVVREVTGSAEAERDYNAAAAAGLTRRGYLKGLAQSRKCATARPASPYNELVRATETAQAEKAAEEEAKKAAAAAEKQAKADAEAARKQAKRDAEAAEKAERAAVKAADAGR